MRLLGFIWSRDVGMRVSLAILIALSVTTAAYAFKVETHRVFTQQARAHSVLREGGQVLIFLGLDSDQTFSNHPLEPFSVKKAQRPPAPRRVGCRQ
jgi:hypothetical protein